MFCFSSSFIPFNLRRSIYSAAVAFSFLFGCALRADNVPASNQTGGGVWSASPLSPKVGDVCAVSWSGGGIQGTYSVYLARPGAAAPGDQVNGGYTTSNTTISAGSRSFDISGWWTFSILVNGSTPFATCQINVQPAVPKVSQTIDFTQPTSHRVGDIVELSATASSGLPVTLSVDSGPAVLQTGGLTLRLTGTGSVTVRASQIGNTTYFPATDVVRTFIVDAALGSGGTPSSFPAAGAVPTLQYSSVLVGALPGEVSVDNKGAAGYSIPLSIPPGRQGMEPKLSLNYNSRGGNGPVGVGFSFSTGFPQAITRGRTIQARDGETRGVIFNDQADKLYLDGKRLICISGTYGTPNSQYRTEIDSFVTIVASSASNSGHIDTFVVTEKSGTKMTFGKLGSATDGYHCGMVQNSAAWTVDEMAAEWALKRVEDTLGNTVDLHYLDAGFGEYLLDRISYTGSASGSRQPNGEIRLLYNTTVVTGNLANDTSRRDATTRYEGLRAFAMRGRLDRIVALCPDGTGASTIASAFDLTYEYAPQSGPTRLASVGGAFRDPDQATLHPIKPTSFRWEDSDWAYTDHVMSPALPTAGSQELFAFGDVNGDGRDDLIDLRVAGQINVSLSNGSGFDSPKNWIASAALWPGVPTMAKMCDINGDGLKDIVFATYELNAPSLGICTLISTGSSFVLGPGYCTEAEFQDPDDIVSTPHDILNHEKYSCVSRISVADFTGDGRDDILIHGYDGKLQVLRSEGTYFTKLPAADIGASKLGVQHAWDWSTPINYLGYSVTNKFSVSPMPCDLNGDGLIDYVWTETQQDCSNMWNYSFSITTFAGHREVYAVTSLPGGGFSPKTCVAYTGWGWSDKGAHRANAFVVMPGDVNGDGLTDLTVLMRGEEDDASVYTGTWNGHRQCLLHMTTYLSRGAPGMPQFGSMNSLTGQTTSSDPAHHEQVQLGAVWANPWFDKVEIGQWANDHYENPGQMEEPYRPLLLASALSSSGDNMTMTDLNGDGKADYVWYSTATSTPGWWVMYSQGDRFSAPTQAPAGFTWHHTNAVASGNRFPILSTRAGLDLNGDGITDYAYDDADYSAKPGVKGFHLSQGQQGRRIVSVNNGLRKTDLAYKPITDDSIYTPTRAALAYPIRELRNATYVVSDVYKDSGVDGLANSAHFIYQYSGNTLDLSGRGSLGFHCFVTLDTQTNLFKYQFLTQSFPMTGLTSRDETYRHWTGSSLDRFRFIGAHDNTVVFDKVSSYGTLYPFISRAVESRWEDSTTSHIDFPADPVSSHPEDLFTTPKPSGAHITITAESLFDNQTAVQTTLPGVTGYYATDTNSSGQSAVSGTTSYNVFSSLPGNITYGNLKQLTTNFGGGFTETVTNDYSGNGVISMGLPGTVNTAVTSTNYGSQSAPDKSYSYLVKNGVQTPLVATEMVKGGGVLDLTTTYNRDGYGRVTSKSITGTALFDIGTGAQSVTTYSATAFDEKFDLPITELNAYSHSTTKAYHPILGLLTSVTGPNTDTVTTVYDALGRVIKVVDVLKGVQTETSYAWDSTVLVAGPNNFNGVATNAPITGVVGLKLTSAYSATTTVHPVSTTSVNLQPPVTTYYDRLGRAIRTVKTGFNNQQIYTDTAFNNLGQVIATSLPYPSSGTPLWTKTTYDALGRVATVIAPNGTVTTNTYNGRATSVSVDAPDLGGVNPAPQVNTTVVDAKGRTVKVWNADNVPSFSDTLGSTSTPASIAFDLDGFGRMRTTTLKGQSQTITAQYDALGRQTQLADPDKGIWNYVNSALGSVLKQTDAKTNVTLTTYDLLNRPIVRTATEASNGPVETANWYYYDSITNGHRVSFTDKGWVGALQRDESVTTGAPGYTGTNSATTTVHYYDPKGRPSIDLATIDGKYFYTYSDFDAYNRLWHIRHYWRSAGHESATDEPYLWEDFGYTYNYDSNSYLTSLTDSLNRSWWDTPSYDYMDRVTSVRKGSGYTTTRKYRPEDGVLTDIVTGSGPSVVQNQGFNYDGLGNLTLRTGSGGSEPLTYDALNRLKTSNQGAMVYADNGNITSKPEVGNQTVSLTNYDPVRPHAVTRYTFNGQTIDIAYDANGNLFSRSGGGSTWSMKWAGFDKPRWMAKTTGPTVVGSEFLYNANRSRIIQMEFDALGAAPSHYVRKRLYALGSTLEINYRNKALAGATDNWSLDTVRIYVPGPDGIIGAREFNPGSAADGSEKTLVYHYDHLGSIESITPFASTSGFANDSGGKAGRFSEDAWGQRRNPFTWSGPPVTTGTNASDDGGSDSLTPRGFTGHEMLDDLGLVHMNGRIYDPLLGRMLSADIMVQYPGSLQSYNRYSYVRNNPLTAFDPSGWWEVKVFGLTFTNDGTNRGARAVQAIKNWDRTVDAGPVHLKFTLDTAKENLQQTPSRLANFGKTVTNDLVTKGPIVTILEDLGGGPKIPVGGAGAPKLATVNGATLTGEVATVNATAISGTATLVNNMASADIKPSNGEKIPETPPATEPTNSSGGRKGNAETRAQNQNIAEEAKANGGTHEGGADLPEQRFADPAQPGTKGSRYADVTVKDANGTTTHYQTVDTKANGELTERELDAALDISERSGETVVAIPKKKP